MSTATALRAQRAPGALWRRTIGAVVVLAADSREPLFLGGGAAAVWEELASPETAASLAAALGAPVEEVERVLRELADTGLVAWC